jgi:hypothetical protein
MDSSSYSIRHNKLYNIIIIPNTARIPNTAYANIDSVPFGKNNITERKRRKPTVPNIPTYRHIGDRYTVFFLTLPSFALPIISGVNILINN